MNRYLKSHDFPQDLRTMSYDDLELLTYEIRDFLVEEVSKTGGHLSSNLGIVELSIALHRCFNTPEDKLVWDVGHQTYVHKMLTGRLEGFDSLRQLGGMSGFPKVSESEYDIFDTGHSSTSLSLALGLASARDLSGDNYNVVSVIGDGALTGGLAFEALNNVGNSDTKMIIVLNDNGMSISPNTGGLSKHLGKLRGSRKYISMKAQIKKNISQIPVIGEEVIAGMQHLRDSIKYAVIDGVLFEALGIKYFGPVDGHDIRELCETFELAKDVKGPVLIHAITKKGKGYSKAETNPNVFHGIGPFDMETGQIRKKSSKPSYSNITGEKLIELAEQNDKIAVVSAAMLEGTGLEKFSRRFPKRSFDVGIAEGHGVTFAAGLAKAGMKPFVAIYSTFLQRAYDQIVEDICLQKLPVVLCIDRAGIVGADGETHHGIFDISYLKHIPNLTIMAPKDGMELKQMLLKASEMDTPCAIRYPRGTAPELEEDLPEINKIETGKAQRIKNGNKVDIWAAGAMVEKAVKAAEILSEHDIDTGVVNMRFLKPLDREMLESSAASSEIIVVLEDNVSSGGIGEEICSILSNKKIRTLGIGWPDRFIEHGTCDELYEKYHMDPKSIAERILKELEKQT